MLQEVLQMREWVAILARCAGRRKPRKSPFCQLQAATTDRGDTGIADQQGQMLGEVFTQPTSRCGNGWCVGPRSSVPREQSRKRLLHTLDGSFARSWANARRTRAHGHSEPAPIGCKTDAIAPSKLPFQTDSTAGFPC